MEERKQFKGIIKSKDISERNSEKGKFQVCIYIVHNGITDTNFNTTNPKFFNFNENDEVIIEYEIDGFYKKVKSIRLVSEKKIKKYIITMEEIE